VRLGAGRVTQQFPAADGEAAAKAFDKDHNTKWVTYHDSTWIQYVYPTAPASVTSYGLVSGNDAPDRDPKEWVLLGNNTGPDGDDASDSEWTVLDTRSNQASFAARKTLYEFNVTTPGSFKFYRLKIGAPVSGVSLQLSELELYDASDTNVIGGGEAFQLHDSVLEGVHNLFDHNASTKWATLHSAAWAQYEPLFPSNAVEAYTIVSGNDGPDRDPRDWVLLGNDTGPDGNDASDSEWTVLDARTDQGPFAEREHAYTYTVENPGAFKFYRFKVTENNGAADFIQMSELELLTR
jgi:hypothetical protein